MRDNLKTLVTLLREAARGFRRTPPPQLNRRQKLLMRLEWAGMYWDDNVPYEKGDNWYALTTHCLEPLIERLCKDHVSEDDQCCMPAHRYCIICKKLTPNADTELARSLTW